MMQYRILLGLTLISCMISVATAAPEPHVFNLHGGYFYGPGPIAPDTRLPDGVIHNITFDLDKLAGAAAFGKGGRILSDNETTANANIDAGALEIGGPGKNKTFWLYAVAGGPLAGEEHYSFDANYNMLWTVDMALDPGFAEGIVRVNKYELTTGYRKVPASIQTQNGLPEGYDKAGSLVSGTTIVGRVGDFDNNGFLDGIIVATANVPMQADMLPGAPVANLRGFSTDIAISPLFALELTLHGIANMQPLVEQSFTGGHIPELTAYLSDIRERLLAARANYETAFIHAPAATKMDLHEISWRLESIRQLFFIPWAFLTTYKYPSGNASESVMDATTRALAKTAALAKLLEQRRLGSKP
ncbi:hypothetical protein TI04_00555 [Achromatium sp. WMS2]|nr:hypothetical protein TI04_00555 [Achromatium sp. WMS2]